jgi:hypothetical protein
MQQAAQTTLGALPTYLTGAVHACVAAADARKGPFTRWDIPWYFSDGLL